MWQQGLWQKGLWHEQLHALLLTVQPLMLMACVGSYFPYPTFLIYFFIFQKWPNKASTVYIRLFHPPELQAVRNLLPVTG